MRSKILMTILVNNQVTGFLNYPAHQEWVWFRKIEATYLVAEHGLAFLVEVIQEGRYPNVSEAPILFSFLLDVGSVNKTILHNLPRFRPNLDELNAIVLSHGHYDHTGALLPVLSQLRHPVKIVAHPDVQLPRYFKRESSIKTEALLGKTPDELEPMVRSKAIAWFSGISASQLKQEGGEVILTAEPTLLYEDESYRIQTTGEIPRTHPEEDVKGFIRLSGNRTEKDEIMDDQSVVIERKGEYTILLLGCCHSGLMNTMDAARSLASSPMTYIIGGTHMTGASPERMEATLAQLQALPGKKFIFPIHCTGPEFLEFIKRQSDPALMAYDASAGTQFLF